jgi:hypothetical protein
MQNSQEQPRRTVHLALAGLAVFALIPALWFGCAPDGEEETLAENEPSSDEDATPRAVAIASESTCVTLFAGQTIDAGTVCVSVDNNLDTSAQCAAQGTKGALNVVFTTINGWQLTEAHLAAGDSFADIPINNKGNPKIGNFPYNSGDITGATTHAFQVPLCTFGLDGAAEVCDPVTAYLAAHAALRKDNGDGTYQTETGWGDGSQFVEKGSWAEFFTMELECKKDDEPPPVESCETSFAKADSGVCFIGADFDGDGADDGFSRWGWSNGPLAPGSSGTWPVYAAAGQCDISKGTHIGNIAVSYGSDGTATVSFDRLADFYLDEEHLYVGNEPLPRDNGEYTVAPGQYPIVKELDNATHTENTVSGLSGDIYVVYHAVACGTYGP